MTTEQPTVADVRALESFLVSAGETALLLTFQGILRSHEDYRAQALALSTPPADDVRELLADARRLVDSWDRRGSWSADSPVGMVMRLADALEAAEVHPRGTVAPPADDVREALAFHLFAEESTQDEEFTRRVWENHPDEHPVKRLYFDQSDAIRSAFEVRPRGTVTDAEVEQARIAYQDFPGDYVERSSSGWQASRMRAALEAARGVRP